MKIKLKKNCELECWSGLEERLVNFKKGEVFEVEEFDKENYVSEDSYFGTIYIEKCLCE